MPNIKKIKKKVIFLIYNITTVGGMERITTIKANKLVDMGYSVDIISLDSRPPAQECQTTKRVSSYFDLDSRVRVIDLGICIKGGVGGYLFRHTIYKYRLKNRLTKELKKIEADIVVSLIPEYADIITSIKDGSKKIFETHFSYHTPYYTSFYKYPKPLSSFLKWRWKKKNNSYNLYDRVVVLSQKDREVRALKNSIVIPNPITIQSGEFRVERTKKRVISVGRYVKVKGFDILLKAWSIAIKENPDWRLTIYGNKTALTNRLHTLTKKLSIEDSVELMGPTKNIVEQYHQSSIFACSSLIEGFPLGVCEAISCGLPIVGFDTEGVSELLIDGITGLSGGEVGNINSFSKALSRIMTDKILREKLSLQAYKESQKYSLERVSEMWDELYLTI